MPPALHGFTDTLGGETMLCTDAKATVAMRRGRSTSASEKGGLVNIVLLAPDSQL
jgi:hypothetical protein